MTLVAKVLSNCQNWLVEKGKEYRVRGVQGELVYLEHPLYPLVNPTLLKSEVELRTK